MLFLKFLNCGVLKTRFVLNWIFSAGAITCSHILQTFFTDFVWAFGVAILQKIKKLFVQRIFGLMTFIALACHIIIINMQKQKIELSTFHKGLFERSRTESSHRLKIDVLPELKLKIKQELTEEEKRCVCDDPLEKYLIELTTSRAAEIQGMTKVQEIINHTLSEVRTQPVYWATGSQVWTNILKKTEEELQKSREVTLAYEKDLVTYRQLGSYFTKLVPAPFESNLVQCIPQDYDTYSNFCVQKSWERISFYLIVELKRYLVKVRQEEQIFVENYLLELFLCSEKRRKKKRIKDEELDNNYIWTDFLAFIGERLVEIISTDYQAEQIAIINAIACYQLMNSKMAIQYSAKQYEEAVDSIEAELWSQKELQTVADGWLNKYVNNEQNKFNEEIESRNKAQPIVGIPGCLDPLQKIEEMQKTWADIKENPDFQSLSKYKYHHEKRPQLTEQEHKKLLEGLLLYHCHTVNNGKIAEFIRPDFPPAYVKNLKSVYMRNMKQRISNGECGGGEHGNYISKKEFIRRDLENFNIRWFTRNKPVRKRKKLSDSDEPESSWQYK